MLSQVQAGLDLEVPDAPAGPEEFGRGEQLLKEELQELDFYIQNGLKDEAQSLLKELKHRWSDHPYVARRAKAVERL